MKNLLFLIFSLLLSVRLFADVPSPQEEFEHTIRVIEKYAAKDIQPQSYTDYILYSIAAFAIAFLIWIYIKEKRKE
jgi:hypothetical protein